MKKTLFLILFLLWGILGFAAVSENFQMNVIIPRDTIKVNLQFDGVWVGPGNVTLIKQLKDYVILQGKDNASTWSAKGIINGKTLICRGTGVTNDGNVFVYESNMSFENEILLDEWKATFPGGKILEGKDELKRIPLGEKKEKEKRPNVIYR